MCGCIKDERSGQAAGWESSFAVLHFNSGGGGPSRFCSGFWQPVVPSAGVDALEEGVFSFFVHVCPAAASIFSKRLLRTDYET